MKWKVIMMKWNININDDDNNNEVMIEWNINEEMIMIMK